MVRRVRSAALACALAMAFSACGGGEAPAGAGDSPDGGARRDGGADAGRPRITWPEESFAIEGATDPSLVRSPAGARTLIYRKDGRIWAWRDPPAGAPVELAAAATDLTDMSVAASPDSDRIVVAWDGMVVSLTGGIPDSPGFLVYGGMASLSAHGAGWLGGRPVVSAYTSDLWYGNDHYPPVFLAFAADLATPGARPLGQPASAQVIDASANAFHHYDEGHRFLDLGDGRALLFRTHALRDPADPADGEVGARWHHLVRESSSADPCFLVSARAGLLEIPGVAWIQPHDLGDGRYALTWAETTDSLVYDVFVAGLGIADDGTPSLSTAPVNVSMTPGLTANSDHPVVLPTGDGRFWIAWRETSFGPMVALLDGRDFHVLAYGGPAQELSCNLASSLGAVVDAEGTLHLAAGFIPEVTVTDEGGTHEEGRLFVRYFEIRLP